MIDKHWFESIICGNQDLTLDVESDSDPEKWKKTTAFNPGILTESGSDHSDHNETETLSDTPPAPARPGS